jgi:hypothetical protein
MLWNELSCLPKLTDMSLVDLDHIHIPVKFREAINPLGELELRRALTRLHFFPALVGRA